MLSGTNLNNNNSFPSRSGTFKRFRNALASSSSIFSSDHQQHAEADNVNHHQYQNTPKLYSVCLSDGIRSLETLSPGMYTFIVNAGQAQAQNNPYAQPQLQSNLRFFSPSGERIHDGLPKHLQNLKSSSNVSSNNKGAAMMISDEEKMFSVTPINASLVSSASNVNGGRPPTQSSGKQTMGLSRKSPQELLQDFKDEERAPEVKRFFLNVMDLEFTKSLLTSSQVTNNNGGPVEEVVCILTMAKQKRATSCIPLSLASASKSGGKMQVVSGSCMESFIFDLPTPQKAQSGNGDQVLSLLIYTKSPSSSVGGGSKTLSHSPSISSLNSNSSSPLKSNSFLSLKRLGLQSSVSSNSISTILNGQQHDESNQNVERMPAHPGDIGNFLCDLSITIPCSHAFSKVEGWHFLHSTPGGSGGKAKVGGGGGGEVGRVRVEMGIFSDVDFVPIPDVPRQFEEMKDYLNFYLMTPGGLIWDKKYVLGSPTSLQVYSSSSYHSLEGEEGEVQCEIPFRQLQSVSRAKRDFMAAPNTLILGIRMPWRSTTHAGVMVRGGGGNKGTGIGERWKDQLIEGGVEGDKKEDRMVVYIYLGADSSARMEAWESFLSCHIERHAISRGL